MAYVPGYEHDVFVSYAHGDDRAWIDRLVDRLEPALKQRLGIKAASGSTTKTCGRSRDFSQEIPDSVESSAVFLLLASPSYIRSEYCVEQECRVFEKTIDARRAASRARVRQRAVRAALSDSAGRRQRALVAVSRADRHRVLQRVGDVRDRQPGVRDTASAGWPASS